MALVALSNPAARGDIYRLSLKTRAEVVGMSTNVNETKMMNQSTSTWPGYSLIGEEDLIEVARCFTYLGATISEDDHEDEEVRGITLAKKAYFVRFTIFSSRDIHKRQKYKAFIQSTLYYGSEIWILTQRPLVRSNISDANPRPHIAYRNGEWRIQYNMVVCPLNKEEVYCHFNKPTNTEDINRLAMSWDYTTVEYQKQSSQETLLRAKDHRREDDKMLPRVRYRCWEASPYEMDRQYRGVQDLSLIHI